MPLTMCRQDRPHRSLSPLTGRVTVRVVLVLCLACPWLLAVSAGQADTSAVTVTITSTPPLHDVRPDADLAHVTLHVWLNGTPLARGHIQVRVTAPPHPALLSTDFPIVEGTDLLALSSDIQDGVF